MERLQAETRRILDQRGAQQLRVLGDGLAGSSVGGTEDDLQALAQAAAEDGISLEAAAAYVRGRCDGVDEAWRTQRVDVVWTGPSGSVPVRATAAVLIDVIAAASHELVLMTYSAKPHEAIRQGLAAGVARGVRVDVVVETLRVLARPSRAPNRLRRFGECPGSSCGTGRREIDRRTPRRCTRR